MKLYVAPAACSMSCHIAFEESKVPFEAIVADWENTARWAEIVKFNPMEAVPVLVLDDGKVLTQNSAILTYLAEKAPESGLLPKVGTFERAQAFQWLSWVAADLHKSYGALFDETTSAEDRKEWTAEIDKMLSIADKHLAGKTFLVGNQFTVADAYLFTVYGWSKHVKLPTDKYRNLNDYSGRIAERPAVRAAMKREGLLK